MKKLAIYLLASVMALSFCSCGMVTITSVNSNPTDNTSSAEPAPTAKADRYKADFDEDEIFADNISQQAAQHIDPHIKQAVKLMNTVRADDYVYDALYCDYSQRPKARDTIKDPLSMQMYDIMVGKTFAFEDYCFDNSFAPGDLFNAVVTANDAVRMDWPYLSLYCDMEIKGNTFRSVYYLPGDWINTPCTDIEKVKTEVAIFDSIVNRILQKMPQNLTNWEKCQYFAFVIASAVEYDDTFETMGNSYQAFDALVNGRALCEGYALAFYYLCQQEDIACWYCLGEAPYELGYHAWNVVETRQGPVYIDITWYDEEGTFQSYRDGKTNYLFMNEEDFDYYGYIEKSRR